MTINRTFYISKKKVMQAGEFIMEHGRDIEKVLFNHYFKKAPISSVVSVLEGYCNEDGGVGRMDLDMEFEGSTPICCAQFFSILHEMKVASEFSTVNKVLGYLEKGIQKGGYWLPIVPKIMDAPRAVWWNWNEGQSRKYFFNPTCELIGSFYHFGGGDYRAFSKELLDILYEELLHKFVGTLEMHDVLSLMQLCRILPDIMAEKFVDILKPHLKEMLVTDKNEWGNYVMSPLTVFRFPLDPLYYEFEKEINSNLDYEIKMQSEDGIWLPKWHWGQFEEEFKARENQIAANVTVNRLIQLKNFGRIANMK